MVSESSGQVTVSSALPPESRELTPLTGSTAEITVVPGPTASTKAPSAEPDAIATPSWLDCQTTRAVTSVLPPAASDASAVNRGRSPATTVSTAGTTRIATGGPADGRVVEVVDVAGASEADVLVDVGVLAVVVVLAFVGAVVAGGKPGAVVEVVVVEGVEVVDGGLASVPSTATQSSRAPPRLSTPDP